MPLAPSASGNLLTVLLISPRWTLRVSRDSHPGSLVVIQLPRTRTGRALLVFLVVLTCCAYFFPMLNNWGSNSRMNLIYALGDQGRVQIDDYHQNTGDKAQFRGHYYTDKSIGPSLLGLPFYMVFKALVRLPPVARLASGDRGPGTLPTLHEVYRRYHLPVPGTPGAGHPPLYHAMALVFVTFFAMAVTSAMLGGALYLLADRFTAVPGNAVGLAVAFALGTPAFAYSNQLYPHQAAAFGGFVGFFMLWRVSEEGASKRWLWLVGALFGYAAASEYVWAPLLTLVVLGVGLRLCPRRDLLRIAGGAAPWFIATAFYNVAAFGTPIPAGYRYTAFSSPSEFGLFGLGAPAGFGTPSWESLYGITFSPYRGVFLLSPFLLLAPAGLYAMFRHDSRTRALSLTIIAISVALLLYNASYWAWSGADSVGPRHLISLLPFLALPIVFVLNEVRRAWQKAAVAALVILSIAHVWIQSLAAQAFPSEIIGQPLLEYGLPLVLAGDLRLNVGNVLGLRGLTVVIPLLALVAAILWTVPWAERLWMRRRMARGIDSIANTPAGPWSA
jgi:hypothetical protein